MNFFYSETDGVTLFSGVRDRDDIRQSIKLPYKIFPKTKFSENSEDSFGNTALRVWYFSSNKVMEIEFYTPECNFFYKTYDLLSMTYGELLAVVKLHGWETVDPGEGLGFDLEGGSVRLYIPDIEDDGLNAKCKAVCVVVPPLN